MKHSWKISIPKAEATIPIKTMKKKKGCNQFPSFMSEPDLSTRSKTCMHLENLKFFSRPRSPQTYVRHAQSHQRAGASTGSITIIQNTVISVYDVEHQRTVNTKLGKQTILVFRSNQEFLPLIPKNRLEKTKR